jgi:hypothetical protein
MMIPVPASGVLESVQGIEDAQHVRCITEVEITARIRDTILAWPEGSSYLGFIFAKAETARDVEDALRSAHSKLRFNIKETLPVEHPVTGKILTPAELALRFRCHVAFREFRALAKEKLFQLLFHDFLRIGVERVQPVLVHDHF